MITYKKLSLATTAVCLLALSACSSMVSKPVDEAKRDTSGSFDGRWKIAMLDAPEKQNIQNWVFTCPNMAGELNLQVSNGQARLRLNNQNHTAFVDSRGQMRFEIPLKGVARESAQSFESITKGQRTMIIQGTLGGKSSSGLVTYGVAQFGNNGCSTRAKFLKS